MNLAKQAHLHKAVHLSVASSVGVLIIATLMLNNFIPGQAGNVLSQTTANTTDQSARTSDYAITVNGASAGVLNAVSGNKRFTVNLIIENLTSTTMQLSPGLQMFLRTATGQQYDMTAKYLTPGLVLGGPLSPGAKSDLSIDFEIPSAAEPASFVYQSNAGTTPSVIKL